jgi:hypothetical protein
MEDQTHTGKCLCEAVQYTVTGTPVKVFACYCTDCQKGAGGDRQIVRTLPCLPSNPKISNLQNANPIAQVNCQKLTISQIAKFPASAITVTAGEDKIKKYIVTKTSSGSPKHKVFCGECGCTLWTIPMHHGGDAFIIRTSLLENG